MKIRYPAAAGTFYPSQPEQLKKLIEKFLTQARAPELTGKVKALVVPHAGYIYSGTVAAYAYQLLKEMEMPPKKIVLLGPAHYFAITQPSFSSADIWKTPLAEIKTLKPPDLSEFNDAAHQPEHSLEVQLPFLQMVLKNFQILPILINDESQSKKLADNLASIIDEQTLLIASSDLSHFYPLREAEKIDALANQYIPVLAVEKTKNEVEACGLAGILTAMHLAKKFNWQGQFLKHQTSYDASGDASRVVGYGAYVFIK